METPISEVPQIIDATAFVLVPIISGLITQVVKRLGFTRMEDGERVTTKLGQRVLPTVAVFLGVASGIYFIEAAIEMQVLVGAALGLMAIGGQDGWKKTFGKSKSQ